jgi:hypothetical protein
VRDHSNLAGRSSGVLVAAAITYSTTVCVTMYVYYMHLWADMVRWLVLTAETERDADSDVDPDHVCKGGVHLHVEQIQDLCWTPATKLLLRRPGWVAFVSWFCFHGCAINLMCLACLLWSQQLVRRLLPAMFSEQMLDV